MCEIEAQRLDSVLGSATAPPNDEAILEVIEHPAIRGLDAEEVWALLGFLRHERRQQWVKLIVESRLGGQGEELAARGAFGHPEEVPQKGEVPGEAGWNYFFHGRGCCFSHQDGTEIDVDFADDGSAEEIDAFFYNNYLKYSPSLGWSERQLARTEALCQAWHFDLERLERFGLIAKQWRFRLTEEGRHFAAAVEPVAEAIEAAASQPEKRVLLLCLLGDFCAATEFKEAVSPIVRQRLVDAAARLHSHRAKRIRLAMSASLKPDQSHIAALAALGESEAGRQVVELLLSRPANGASHRALDILLEWDRPGLPGLLGKALSVHAPTGLIKRWLLSQHGGDDSDDLPRKSLVIKICRALLRSWERLTASGLDIISMRKILRSDFAACEAEAGFYLFLLDEKTGLAKLERALSSRIPLNSKEAAAFLAMIGGPACVDILIERSRGEPENGGLEAACMLEQVDDDPRAREAADYWRRRFDGYEEAEGEEVELFGKTHRVWSFDDLARVNAREEAEYFAERARREYQPFLAEWCW